MAKSSSALTITQNSPTGSLEERLQEHPELREKIEALISVVENAQGDVKTANEAEQRVIEEIQKLGQAALQGWAIQQQQRQQQDFTSNHPEAHRSGKKNSTGTADSASSKSLNRPTRRGKEAV
jgi:phosphoribosyl-dephospho-CoA transferase